MKAKSYKLSQTAQQHLINIKTYTVEQFGDAQWRKYKTILLDGFQLLADNPALAKSCPDIYPNGLYYPLGKHMAYFTIERYGIYVVAVLGQSQLPQRHL